MKNYYIVGGMPEAVQMCVDTHDYKEVKSADNTKAKSLHMFCNRYSPKMAIKHFLSVGMTLQNINNSFKKIIIVKDGAG